ncbi:WW domain-binding protein 2-like [Argonauta hians]
MSLNTAHCEYGVLLYTGESILIYCDGVQVSFAGGDLPKGNKKGRIYLTTHRVVFLNNAKQDSLLSFSLPFFTMKEVELEQPVFGANYIKGRVMAEVGGKWSGNAIFKITFNKGGAIEFGQAMLQAGKLVSSYLSNYQPPPYMPPQEPFYQPAPPAYTATNYGWVPYQTFPNAPPASEVYMTEAPPPYPGVANNTSPSAPGSAHDAKAREAAGSAYYNPANPHNVYMPSPSEPPPPYTAVGKKNN